MRGSLSREENYSSLFLLFLEENSSTGTFFNKSLRWMQRLQSVTTAFYVKKKIHLRHKWLRGQRVQLIKVEKPHEQNGRCLFCGRSNRKILQICLIQYAAFSGFNVVENVFKRITAIKLITRMDILISYSIVKLLFREIENSSSKILID